MIRVLFFVYSQSVPILFEKCYHISPWTTHSHMINSIIIFRWFTLITTTNMLFTQYNTRWIFFFFMIFDTFRTRTKILYQVNSVHECTRVTFKCLMNVKFARLISVRNRLKLYLRLPCVIIIITESA